MEERREHAVRGGGGRIGEARTAPLGPSKPCRAPPQFPHGPLKVLPEPVLRVPPTPHAPSRALWGLPVPSSGSSRTLPAPKNRPPSFPFPQPFPDSLMDPPIPYQHSQPLLTPIKSLPNPSGSPTNPSGLVGTIPKSPSRPVILP